MNPVSEVTYWTKRLLLGLFGPAQLDEEHDPVERLKREHKRATAAHGQAPDKATGHDLEAKAAGALQAEAERRAREL